MGIYMAPDYTRSVPGGAPGKDPDKMARTPEPCYACNGAGKNTTDTWLTGTTVTLTCGVCRGTGKVTCICREGAEVHYLTCPSRLPLDSRRVQAENQGAKVQDLSVSREAIEQARARRAAFDAGRTHCHGCDLPAAPRGLDAPLDAPRLVHPCIRCGSTGPGYCAQPLREDNHLCTADIARLEPFGNRLARVA